MGQAMPQADMKRLWDVVLQLLTHNDQLTARDKGWLEDIEPEAMFDTTIILRVTSKATQRAIMDVLNEPLVEALNMVTGKDMFPAVKVVPPSKASDRQKAAGRTDGRDAGDDAPVPRRTPRRQDADADQGGRSRGDRTDRTDGGRVDADARDMRDMRDMRGKSAPYGPARGAQAQTVPPDHPSIDDLTDSFPSSPMVQPTFDTPAYPANGRRIERDPGTHLNKNATFDTFVPGDSNRFARTVALAVAEGSGRDYNPLCIYGGSGLGKTHLLNAIGNYALVKDPTLKVLYVTSEEFTNEFISALQNSARSQGQIAEFNRRYREVDVLLIDDIQFLSGKTETMEQFFHTFNTLYQANKRIVIASDVAPKNLKGFEARLISRFDSGLTVDVKPPDLETRIAILRMIAMRNNVTVPGDVLDLIAERFTENIRELEGALTRVTAVASLNNQPISRALAEQTLQDFFATDVEIKPTNIITQVAKYFRLTFDDLVGPSRTKSIANARQIAMYLAREMTSMSLFDIGQVFGGRDHTTVLHACRRISDEMQEKRDIYNNVMELTIRLKQHPNN